MNKVHQIWELKLTAGGVEHVFIWIPPGRFLMGSPEGVGTVNERPQHEVEITKGFWMGKYPVTIPQYLAFCRDTNGNLPEWLEPSYQFYIRRERSIERHSYYYGSYPVSYDNFVSEDPSDRRPIVGVSWDMAKAFCRWMSTAAGGVIRLPTEAEWEYACRAGSTDERYGNLEQIAWYEGNAMKVTHPVGEKEPNSWGVYDMLGNVREWCHDRYDIEYYSECPGVDPLGSEDSVLRVFRGGSWAAEADHVRAAIRFGTTSDYRYSDMGFRLLRVQPL